MLVIFCFNCGQRSWLFRDPAGPGFHPGTAGRRQPVRSPDSAQGFRGWLVPDQWHDAVATECLLPDRSVYLGDPRVEAGPGRAGRLQDEAQHPCQRRVLTETRNV